MRYSQRKIKCAFCKKIFRREPSHIARSKRHFCTQLCYSFWLRKNYLGKKNPQYKEKIVIQCLTCKKKYKVWPSRIEKKFCSRKCKVIWTKKYRSGKSSPCYGSK